MKERIQKILAAAGLDSRRHVEEMVRQGRIAVNGKVVRELPILIDPAADRIEVDGAPFRFKTPKAAPQLYILLNKPKGVYSTNVSQGVQTRAIDLLPPDLPGRVYPVGRLDAESKGLLLLTNDGELTQRLTHPSYGVTKTYRAVVDGFVEPQTLAALEKGVWLSDARTGEGFKASAAHVHVVRRSREKSILEIRLREGRNRQIRRMLAQLGHKVRDLTRTQIGPLVLKGLSPGQSRLLTPREVKALKGLGSPARAPSYSAKKKTK
jgi:23S rRNA pseudouridine2605 synthase